MPKGMKFERVFPGGETRALYGRQDASQDARRDARRYFLCPTPLIAPNVETAIKKHALGIAAAA